MILRFNTLSISQKQKNYHISKYILIHSSAKKYKIIGKYSGSKNTNIPKIFQNKK